jgi:hypothetical protein
MNDDWRLRFDLREDGFAHRLLDEIEAFEIDRDLEHSFEDRVIVSRDGSEVYCYAGSREQAEAARQEVESLAARHGWELETELKHWHPTEERWEDADLPLPPDDAGREAERERLIEQEQAEARERGYPEFEVRIDCPSHRDAVQFAEQLRAEGLSSVHRFKYVLVGALDEDSAKALAERLRAEAPAGSEVRAEGTWQVMYAETPRNRYAVMLGGSAI